MFSCYECIIYSLLLRSTIDFFITVRTHVSLSSETKIEHSASKRSTSHATCRVSCSAFSPVGNTEGVRCPRRRYPVRGRPEFLRINFHSHNTDQVETLLMCDASGGDSDPMLNCGCPKMRCNRTLPSEQK